MSSNFLEQLASEWYAYKGYFVRQNVLVGKRAKGGYECELDVVAFNPETQHLVHMEPSMDCDPWGKRERRYLKKFQAGNKYIPALFRGTKLPAKIEQIALLEYASNKNHEMVGGGKVMLVKEFLKEIKEDLSSKLINNNAVSEHMPLLRMVQFMCHYHDFMYQNETAETRENLATANSHTKRRSNKKKEAFREFLEAMALETFVLFYDDFKSGSRDNTIKLLKQKGFTPDSAKTRWSAGRNIFKSNCQIQALEYITSSSRISSIVRAKAQALLLQEKKQMAALV